MAARKSVVINIPFQELKSNTNADNVIVQEPRRPMLNRQSVVGHSEALSSNETRRLFTEDPVRPGLTYLDPGLLGTPEIKHKHELQPPTLPPSAIEGVPTGLELLMDLTKLKVKRQAEFMPEIMSNYETAKRYDILNEKENRIYFAAETNNNNLLTCGGVERPFQISIIDFTGRVVLQLDRACDQALYLTNCCFCCCCWLGRIGGKVDVFLGDGTPLGIIVHAFNWYEPLYNVLDPNGGLLMQIKGVGCGDCCLFKRLASRSNTRFTILTGDGEEVGIIQKDFARVENLIGRRLYVFEHVVDVSAFEARFPVDLDLKLKGLLVGGLFLLNSLYFKHEFPKYETQVKVDIMRDVDLEETSEYMEPSHTSVEESTTKEILKSGVEKRPSKMKVLLGDGTLLGTVAHTFGCYRPVYTVLDSAGAKVMKIAGSGCGDCCIAERLIGKDTLFNVTTLPNGETVGQIKKHSTEVQESLQRTIFLVNYDDVDACGAEVPEDLDIKLKALYLSSIFLMNFMYFEDDGASQDVAEHEAEFLFRENSEENVENPPHH